MLRWIVCFAGVCAYSAMQPSDTAVALQAVKHANDQIIMAYTSIQPSGLANDLTRQQRSLDSSLEDVPELWLPARTLAACLQSHARELDIDLIPSLKDLSLDDEGEEIRFRMQEALTQCVSPWYDSKKGLPPRPDPPSPPSVSVSWLWLLLGCLFVCLAWPQKKKRDLAASAALAHALAPPPASADAAAALANPETQEEPRALRNHVQEDVFSSPAPSCRAASPPSRTQGNDSQTKRRGGRVHSSPPSPCRDTIQRRSCPAGISHQETPESPCRETKQRRSCPPGISRQKTPDHVDPRIKRRRRRSATPEDGWPSPAGASASANE